MNQDIYNQYIDRFKVMTYDMLDKDGAIYTPELIICLVNNLGQIIENMDTRAKKIEIIKFMNICLTEMTRTYIEPVFDPNGDQTNEQSNQDKDYRGPR